MTIAMVTPDSGFSWLVLAAAFCNIGVAMGTTYGVGVFIVEWMDTFSSEPEVVSWVGALNIASVFGLLEPFKVGQWLKSVFLAKVRPNGHFTGL